MRRWFIQIRPGPDASDASEGARPEPRGADDADVAAGVAEPIATSEGPGDGHGAGETAPWKPRLTPLGIW